MRKMFYYTLASSALMLTLALSDAAAAYAIHDGHDHAHEQARHSNSSRASRRVSKARKGSIRRAVSYACPMHLDMRSRTRGECPKCGMSLVAATRGAKSAAASEGEDVGANEARPNL